MKVSMISQRYEWSDKYYLKQLEGAGSINTKPPENTVTPEK